VAKLINLVAKLDSDNLVAKLINLVAKLDSDNLVAKLDRDSEGGVAAI